ncbi:hypothetical protein V6615_01760 [Oscillospiraceae bacterium PP1C4]
MKFSKRYIALVLAVAFAMESTSAFAAAPTDYPKIDSFSLTASGEELLKTALGLRRFELVQYPEPIKDPLEYHLGKLVFYISSTKLRDELKVELEAFDKTVTLKETHYKVTFGFQGTKYNNDSFEMKIPGPVDGTDLILSTIQSPVYFQMKEDSTSWAYPVEFINDQFLTAIVHIQGDTSPIELSRGVDKFHPSYDAMTHTMTMVSSDNQYTDIYNALEFTPHYTYGSSLDEKTLDNKHIVKKDGISDTSLIINLFEPRSIFVKNAEGATQEYKLVLDMPWRLVLDKKSQTVGGYQVQNILDNNNLAEVYNDMVDTLPKGHAVTIVIAPPAGKAVAEATLKTERGGKITPQIQGNNIVFTMPNDVVTLAGVTFKDEVITRYPITTQFSQPMGTVMLSDGTNPITQAAEGQKIIATAVADAGDDHTEYAFDRWETADITLNDTASKNNPLSFTMPNKPVTLNAVFKKVGTEITVIKGPLTVPTRISLSDRPPHTRTVASLRSLIPKIISLRSRTLLQQDIGETFLIKKGNELDPVLNNPHPAFELLGWEIKDEDGATVLPIESFDTAETASNGRRYPFKNIRFKAQGEKMTLTAKFKAIPFASVTASANDETMGKATAKVDGQNDTNVVLGNDKVTLTATPEKDFVLEKWEVLKGDVTVTPVENDKNVCTFIMPSGKDVEVKAHFIKDPTLLSDKKEIVLVQLLNTDKTVLKSADKRGASFTIDLTGQPQEIANKIESGGLYLKIVTSDLSKIAQENGYNEADGSFKWSKGEVMCNMQLNRATKFTVTAENGTKQDYTITITYPGIETADTVDEIAKQLTGITESNASTNQAKVNAAAANLEKINEAELESKEKTVKSIESLYTAANSLTVAVDDTAGMSTVQTGAAFAAASGTVTLKVNEVTKSKPIPKEYGNYEVKPLDIRLFVGAMEKSTVRIPIRITMDIPANLKGASAIRVLHYHGTQTTPAVITPKISEGKLQFSMKSFSHVYLAGDTGSGDKYNIITSGLVGGKVTASPNPAAAGTTVTVTVTPDSGKQMVSGSLKYTVAAPGGQTVSIDEKTKQFNMPAQEISISCLFEDASVNPPIEDYTDPRITSFVIDGVKGIINNRTGAITMSLPHGTDVTKLVPSIATKNVKSITPENGVVQNFTNSITYTIVGTDGSSRQYVATVYVKKGSDSDQMWDKLTDFTNKTPWWEYAEDQTSEWNYPRYWR